MRQRKNGWASPQDSESIEILGKELRNQKLLQVKKEKSLRFTAYSVFHPQECKAAGNQHKRQDLTEVTCIFFPPVNL